MKPVLLSLLLVTSAMTQGGAQPPTAPPAPPAIEHREEAATGAGAMKSDFTAQTTQYSIGTPTEEEQYYLELINRARANPTAEGIRMATSTDQDVLDAIDFFNVDLEMMKDEFAALPVQPPLAMNEKLTNAARGHTQWQLDNATQNHTGAGGSTPSQRVTAAGYIWSRVGESVYTNADSVFYGHAGFQIDWGAGPGGMQPDRGHRENNHSGDFREVGVGVILGSNTVAGNTVGPQLVTQNFAAANPNNQAFVTGVAYYDLNANSIFDPGEGIGGLTVNVNGATFHAVTTSTGGYAVPVPTTNATRAVTFTGLNANGGSDAIITGGTNVKVDFKPAYTPPALSGPDAASTVAATNYTFSTVIGATSYKGRSVADANAASDGADNTSRMTVATTGGYAVTSTSIKDSGTGAYRLAHPNSGGDQRLTYINSFHVKAGASVNLRSRHGMADPTQTAQVEVTTNGGLTWEAVFTQVGSGGNGETTFQTRNISLAAYAGKDIRLRFSYLLAPGSFRPVGNATAGWFIDTISFTNLVDLTNATTTTLPAGTIFSYTAAATGDFLLAVSPVISGRDFGFGVAKAITATATPPSLAEITVEQAGTPLTDGTSTVAYGTRMLNDDDVKTFTLRNDGTEDLTGISLSVAGAHPADFVAGNLGATTLAPGNTTTFDVTFTAATQGARAAILRIASNDANENPFDVNLTGAASNAPSITLPPTSIVKIEGAAATFSVTATHPTLSPTYQWKKNNVNIKNATASTLNIPQAKAADAGSYTVVVSASGESVKSASATLAVVKPLVQTQVLAHGAKLKLTVTVTGEAGLAWTKTHGTPAATDPVPGSANKKVLDLGTLDAATSSGVYTCEATPPGGGTSVTAGEFDVRVFNAKPQVTQNQALPTPGAVGSPYSHQIKLNGGLEESPVSYSVKNLPTGLVLNTKLGTISGVPTVAKTFKVTVTATNGKGSTSSAEQDVLINPLPPGVAGSFVGMVDRDTTLNAGLGGRVDLTITSAGGITGSMMMGTLKHSFKGTIQIDTVPPIDAPGASIHVPRTGKTPLVFELVLDPANNRMAASTEVNDGAGGHAAAVTGWRNVWSTLDPATAAPKLYTYALKPPAAMPDVPRGDGYGSFTLGKDGKLKAAGKLADGENHTCAGLAGPQGQILIFQTFTTTKGSVLGVLDIDHDNNGVMDDAGLTGTLSWQRPANAKSRVYKDGFGPVDITAVGARYVAPAPALILGMALGDKARITFADGGLVGAAIDPEVDGFDILAGSKPSFVGAVNAGNVKLTVSATTGVLSGSFLLEDDEQRAAFTGKKLKRTALFNGILTHDGTKPVGLGHFLLAEMPQDVPPPAGTTPTTTRMLSGSVVLEKK